MFAGMDEIDWRSMRHAYGPAVEVPDLLRGLLDPDPAVREESLDALYGGVHHQSDVYDCTVAAVPFLIEALTTPGTPGREGIAELLASIGAADDWPISDGDGGMIALTRRARGLIAAAAPELLGLTADPDPALRAAMPRLLTVCEAEHRIAGLLIGRLAAEADGDVRRAVLDGLSRVAVLSGDEHLTTHLLDIAGSAPEASTSVAALIAVARIDPDRIPVDGTADLLERAYAEESAPAERVGSATNTLIGSIRVAREKADAGRRAPHAARLIDQLTDVLGPRVAERTAILRQLLRSPHADVIDDALYGTGKLIDRWRGDHDGLVRLIAGHLAHPDERIAEHAARVLRYWAPLTAPVADPVAAALAALDALPWRDGLPAWTIPYQSDPPGLHPTLETLGDLGDERALPCLLTALELDRCPRSTGYLLARYPQQAERIVAAILSVFLVPHADDRRRPEWYGFLTALSAYGAAAAPAVPRLLATTLDEWSAATLGRIGPGAVEAVPALRVAATGDNASLAVAAAAALWRIEGSPEALPLLTARIDGSAGVAALQELAAMGAVAETAAPYVATFLETPDRHWWRPAGAAIALWRIAGDAGRALPVLAAAWHGNQHTRREIAETAAGPLAAGLEPLLRAELAASRRHGLSETGWSSRQVTDDERLLAACRAVLTSLER